MQRFTFSVLLALAGVLCLAQDPRGTIIGRVEDHTGAVIPGVSVKAINSETGVVTPAQTNEAGKFNLPYLAPGNYRVTADSQGFKNYIRNAVEVRVAESVELVIRLEIGSISESVEVNDTPPLLDTAQASVGQVMDNRRVMQLPQRGGNPMELALLSPGVVNGTDMRLRKAGTPDATSQISSDGSPTNTTEFQIDGVTNTASDKGGGSARVAYSPPSSAIREFRINTTPYDASAGHSVGPTVNVSTASGANQVHGEMLYWLRNSALDARNFFNNKNNTAKPVYNDNRYGAAAGGPVYLPRVYDGRNRTFFFYAWQANKWGIPQSFTRTVPTAPQREGDFSSLLRLSNGSAYQIYDPATTAAAGNQFRRDPFPGNVIPKSRLDTLGLNLVKFYALPNQPGTADGVNNFFSSRGNKQNYWTHFVKFDHVVNPNHRFFVRVHKDEYTNVKNNDFGNEVNSIRAVRANQGASFDDVLVLGPTMILNFRYGLTHATFTQERLSAATDLAGLGFSKNLLSLMEAGYAPLPRIQTAQYATLSNWENPGDGGNRSLTHTFTVNATKLRGNHTVRFGADYRVYRTFNDRRPQGVAPDFNFNQTYTRGPVDNSPNSPIGQGLAALLLGIPGPDSVMEMTASSALQNQFLGLYVQDDFKVTPKLTVSLGLRYELDGRMTERFNRMVANFDFDAANPLEAAARANYARSPIPEISPADFRVRGGLKFVGANGLGRSPFAAEWTNFEPRVSFVWSFAKDTLLNGGYAIYHDSVGLTGFAALQTGFTQPTPIQASLDNGLSYVANTANPLPRGLTPPLGANGGLTTNLGQDIESFYRDMTRPYVQRWSFGLQRLLPGQMKVQASYVGAHAIRIGTTRQYNVLPRPYWSTKPTRDQQTIDYLGATFPSPFQGLNPVYTARMSRANLLRPYPEFGAISAVEPIGASWYNSLQMLAERRLRQGFTLQLGYTFSKLMEAVEFENNVDTMPARVIGAMDRPHRITATGIWEIPVGRDRRFGRSLAAPLNAVVGGWQISGVMAQQSGGAIGFPAATSFLGDIKSIPLSSDKRNVDMWFNVNAGFNRDSRQQLQNNLRTTPPRFSGLRSAGQADWQFTILKNFPVRERLNMEFRAEVYNALEPRQLRGAEPYSGELGIRACDHDSRRRAQLANGAEDDVLTRGQANRLRGGLGRRWRPGAQANRLRHICTRAID